MQVSAMQLAPSSIKQGKKFKQDFCPVFYASSPSEVDALPLQRDDKIVYLSDPGEGECRVWVKGKTYNSACFGNDDELTKNSHISRSGKGSDTHWALVRTPDGTKGWLWIKDADFKNIRGISKHN